MEIWPIVNQIIMLFMLIGVGLLLRKLNIFTDGVIKGVNALVMTVTWPLLMIATTQKDYTPETLSTFAWVFFGSIAILAASLIALFVIFRRTNRDAAPVMSMLCAMPNTGFFGIPIIQALYGDMGLLYLSAYIIGFNVVLWTIGVTLYAGRGAKAVKNLLNPGIVSAAIGISLFLLRIRLPGPLLGAVNQLAVMNTPLSMLILGARMDALRLDHLSDHRIWSSTAIKLVAQPLLSLLALRLMGASGLALMILVACTAMPAAAASQMMTERYGGDVLLSAKGMTISTLCSVITLPAIMWLANLYV